MTTDLPLARRAVACAAWGLASEAEALVVALESAP